MIVEMVKAAIYIFPFIKELFLGKSKETKDGVKKTPKSPVVKQAPESKAFHYLRQVLITVAILSVMGNVVLVQKIFTMGSALLSLKKEVAVVRNEVEALPPKAPASAPVSANANLSTPQEVEAQVRPVESQTPLVPTPPPVRPLEAAPPRDEHTKEGRRRMAPNNSGRSASPAAVEPDKHYHRLRGMDDIR